MSALDVVMLAAALASGNAPSGAHLVQDHACTSCHGVGLSGVAGNGPRLVGVEHRRSPAQIANAIENPIAPMPNMGFTHAQVLDVVAYLAQLDDGAGGKPVVTIVPSVGSSSALVSVRFAGKPPPGTLVQGTMEMGPNTMGTGWQPLQKTADPHTLRTKLNFAMAGSWMVRVRYGNPPRELDRPIDITSN
jgi:cytochrome c553